MPDSESPLASVTALPRALARGASALTRPLADRTILGSFDRVGYRLHALGFREDDLDVDLTGKVCLVTGANAGIGKAAARGLAERGAETWLLCRDLAKGGEAAEEIRHAAGHDRVHVARLDVSERASIRAFVERFSSEHGLVLVHNAGVLPDERQETSEGIELTFATNVMGPFLLTHLLRPRLAKAAPSRVINVTSGGMYATKVELEDPQWEKREFDGVQAYAETKRAEVILTELWAARLRSEGVVVHSMHPGWADTGSVRSSIPTFYRVTRAILRTPEEGADTIVWLAASDTAAASTGRFWLDRRPQATHWLPWTRESQGERERLWTLCSRLAGLVERPA